MQQLRVDICKIAVMPHSTADVLTRDATRAMAEDYADRPLITMSTRGLGIVSPCRVSCSGRRRRSGRSGSYRAGPGRRQGSVHSHEPAQPGARAQRVARAACLGFRHWAERNLIRISQLPMKL